jgi:hypothetical protein
VKGGLVQRLCDYPMEVWVGLKVSVACAARGREEELFQGVILRLSQKLLSGKLTASKVLVAPRGDAEWGRWIKTEAVRVL